jgi:hypothetical protein
MTEKSHVTMEQHICLICDKQFDTGALLLNQRLRQRFERHTTTGYGLCPEHKKDGFVALIACTGIPTGDHMQPYDAQRTGAVAWVRNEAFAHIFNVPLPKGGVAYVEPDVIEKLEQMAR